MATIALACGDDTLVPADSDSCLVAILPSYGSADTAPSDAGADVLDATVDATSSTRCLPDTLDPSFGEGGIAVLSVMDSVAAIGHQSDGKIVVAGTTAQGALVARLLADGTLDSSFGGGGATVAIPSEHAFGMAIAPNDAITVIGDQGTIVRLYASGAIDMAFADGGATRAPLAPSSVAADGANRLVVATRGYRQHTIARILPSGDLDPSFADGGIAIIQTESCLTGQFEQMLVAAAADGTVFDLDVGDCLDLHYYDDTVLAASGQTSGSLKRNSLPRYIASASADGHDRALVLGSDDGVVDRFLPDAAVDPSFGTNGSASPPEPFAGGALAVTNIGDIVAIGRTGTCGGDAGPCGIVLASFDDNGKPVTAFGKGGVRVAPVQGVVVPSGASMHECTLAVAGFLPGLSVARFVNGH
jgi:uncharacterized delta-60 repeat protein